MAHNFGSLVFTPIVKALQEKYGSRRQYARMEGGGASPDHLGPEESAFIAERDSFYMATVGATGWPYVQHRGGPRGFLKVIDDQTVAFADFRGNKQFITTGNIGTDNRVALIMVDYPRQARLKILGRAEVFEGEHAREWIERLREPGYKALIERAYVITIEGFDWNCPRHIKPRFTAEQIQEALAPFEHRLEDLERESKELREAARSNRSRVQYGKDPEGGKS
ncbi:MAG: pyridoxamine 5-phosphate oxidase-related, FMN-binding [Bryobacterales bacterium]|nr:pyridoxamine 5-phosphate oxidase-related, FMN-binding [Bryobacterales bacterium]